MRFDLILALAAAFQPPQPATVQGRVVDVMLRIPVAAAQVTLDGASRARVVTTASDGSFTFDSVAAGAYAVHVERTGYGGRSMEVRVSNGTVLELELGLDLRPLPLAELSIRVPLPRVGEDRAHGEPARVVPRLARTGMVRGGSPVAELGLAGLARDVRGQDPGDPSDLLYVRGSSLDLKLVLLDGAPVYTPFHAGGLLDPLDAGSLSAARLHVGAAPARLDGGLSYILELRTRPAASSRFTSSGAVDMLSARATAEAPLGGSAGVLATVRGASDWLTESLLGDPLGYGYRDALVRGEWRPDAQSNLRLTGFTNTEEVDLGEGLHDARWGSSALSGAWTRAFEQGSLEVGGAASQAEGSIPRRTGVLDDLESRSTRLRMYADASRRFGAQAISFGAAVERERLNEDTGERVEIASATTFSGYGEVDVRASNELRLRGGLRVEVDATGEVRPAPRLAASWLLGERTSLSVTGGAYHQYVRDRDTTANALVPLRLRAARATHVSLALDQDIGEDSRLELQGFVKRFTDLPTESGEQAYASGIDLWAYREGEALTAWLGYSLTWLWSQQPGDAVSERFSGNQVLSLGMRGRFSSGLFADLGLTYGSGLPFTGIDISRAAPAFATDAPGLANEEASTIRRPPSSLLRVDARIARTWTLERGSRRIALTPYFKLVNALDRRDALFFYDDDNDPDTGGRPLAALPMLPLFGLEWRF